jgi:hypothetical protein
METRGRTIDEIERELSRAGGVTAQRASTAAGN